MLTPEFLFWAVVTGFVVSVGIFLSTWEKNHAGRDLTNKNVELPPAPTSAATVRPKSLWADD